MLIVYFYFRQKLTKTNELNFPSKVLKSLGLIWNIPLILPIFSQIIRQNFPSKNPESFKIPVTIFEVSRKNPSKLVLFTFSKLQKSTRFISFQSSKWTFNFPSKSSYINKNPSLRHIEITKRSVKKSRQKNPSKKKQIQFCLHIENFSSKRNKNHGKKNDKTSYLLENSRQKNLPKSLKS